MSRPGRGHRLFEGGRMRRFARPSPNAHASLISLASLLVIALAPKAFAGDPMLTAGLAPNTVQEGDHTGFVNVLNGALTVPFSIGPTYPVNEALSYGLTLTYSSGLRFWLTQLASPSPIKHPRGRSAVGWGWTMHFGRIGRFPHP